MLSMIISLGLLGIAMKSLPVGTAYAVWVGVGAVGTAILGIVLMGEAANPLRLLSLGLIVTGIVGHQARNASLTNEASQRTGISACKSWLDMSRFGGYLKFCFCILFWGRGGFNLR